MNNLILNKNYQLYEQNGKVFCSSLQVAEAFKKRHDNVLRDIEERIIDVAQSDFTDLNFEVSNFLDTSDFTESNFGLSNFLDTSGKNNPMYLLSKD